MPYTPYGGNLAIAILCIALGIFSLILIFGQGDNMPYGGNLAIAILCIALGIFSLILSLPRYRYNKGRDAFLLVAIGVFFFLLSMGLSFEIGKGNPIENPDFKSGAVYCVESKVTRSGNDYVLVRNTDKDKIYFVKYSEARILPESGCFTKITAGLVPVTPPPVSPPEKTPTTETPTKTK